MYFCTVQFGCHKVHNTHKSTKFVCLPNLNQESRLPEDTYQNSLLDGIRFVVVAFFIYHRSRFKARVFLQRKKSTKFGLFLNFSADSGRLEAVLGWLTVKSTKKPLYRILLFLHMAAGRLYFHY